MMIVAGQLLASHPLRQDPDYPEDEFTYWLLEHGLSRLDKNWLYDRRDPVPLDPLRWKIEKQDTDWRWAVSSTDFEQVLGVSTERLNVWGSWTLKSSLLEESINISSGLVCPEKSRALLRAFQTASDSRDCFIPDYNEEPQVDSGGFLLRGWVAYPDTHRRIDKFDPWSGDLRDLPLTPAKFVQELMTLESDAECRVWYQVNGLNQEDVIWSQMWGSRHNEYDESEGEEGRRLQASFSFLTRFLKKVNMDLIIKVSIKREIRSSRHGNRYEKDLGYIPPYVKFFIVNHEGRIITV